VEGSTSKLQTPEIPGARLVRAYHQLEHQLSLVGGDTVDATGVCKLSSSKYLPPRTYIYIVTYMYIFSAYSSAYLRYRVILII
jgi:hypothetical protein